MGTFLIVMLLILLIGGITAGIFFLNKKRKEELQAIAQELNLKFYPKGHANLTPFLDQMEFFSYGDYRRVYNLLMGKVNHRGESLSVAIFDYYYTLSRRRSTLGRSESNSETFGQTVLLFYDPSLQVPGFSVRPENLLDKLGNLIGYRDINFPEAPVFSKRYRLLSNSEGAVRSLFQSNLLSFYESNKLSTEAQNSYLLIYPAEAGTPKSGTSTWVTSSRTFTESRLIQPVEVKGYLEKGLRLLSLLKKNS